jgi:hypothetical protein
MGWRKVSANRVALPLFFVSVADKGLRDRLNVETSTGLNVTEFEKRSWCHPGCFAQRVRKRLKEKGIAFSLLQKSEPFAAPFEAQGRQGKKERRGLRSESRIEKTLCMTPLRFLQRGAKRLKRRELRFALLQHDAKSAPFEAQGRQGKQE